MPPDPLFDPTITVLVTLVLSLGLFVTDALRYDLIAIGVVLVLAGTRCLTPEQAFAGFSSKAVILIASMYIFSASVTRWGVAEALGKRLLASERGGEAGLTLRLMLLTGLLSGVLSNTGVVALMIPMVSAVARSRGIPISVLLMPMAYASLIGGLLSLVATSKNLAVNGVLAKVGSEPLGLFEFSHYGLIILGIGCLFFIWPGRRFLNRAREHESLSEHYKVPRFITEVLIEPSSNLINRSVSQLDLFKQYGVNVLGIVRAGEEGSILAPGPYNRVRREDTLILQGEPDALLRLQAQETMRLRASVGSGEHRLDSADVSLVEVVLPPESRLVGSTLAEADFQASTGLNVLAFSREGEVRTKRLSDRRLATGDTLLVQGHQRDLERVARQRELLVLGEINPPAQGRGAMITVALLAAVLLFAALNWLPLSVAALAGAMALIGTRCLTIKEAYQSLDPVVLVLVGGMLAMGEAFNEWRLGEDIALHLRSLGDFATNPYVLLAMILVISTILAQLATHIAAAVIMAEVAARLAQQLEFSDRPFLMAVLTGCSCSFMSPVAHPANTMIMGAGDYRYKDFLRVGTPLTIVISVMAWFVLPILWPFQP